MITKITTGRFDDEEASGPTTGWETTTIRFKMSNGRLVAFRVIDINGQDAPNTDFKEVYFPNIDVHGAIIMFTVDDYLSYIRVKDYYRFVVPTMKGKKRRKIPVALVKNKIDLGDDLDIDFHENKRNMELTCMSVKESTNIFKPFEDLARMICPELYTDIQITGYDSHFTEMGQIVALVLHYLSQYYIQNKN